MNQNATTSPEVDRSRTSPWKSSVLDTSFSHTSRDSLAVRFPEAQNRKRMEGGLRCTQLEIVKSKIELEPVARQSPYSPANGIGQARGGGLKQLRRHPYLLRNALGASPLYFKQTVS